MGFNLLAFAGGAAKGLTEEIDKAEEEAKTYATTSTKLMYDKYNKLTADNKELITAASNDLDVIRANFKGKASFTPQQEYQIMLNKPVREQLVKAATDKNIDLSTLNASQIIKMVEDNTPGTAKDRLEQAYAIPKILDQRAKESEKTFGGFMRSFGERAGETAAQKAAATLGVPLEQMRGAMQPQVAPKSTAEFDLSVLKAPQTNDAIVERADAAVTNAGMQFGADSEEYKAAVAKRDKLSKFIPEKTADTLSKRADKLNIEILDTKDPSVKENLTKQLSETQAAIKAHALAITAKTPVEKEKSYNAVKTSLQDYATSRMQEEYGASWQEFVSFKTVKLDDGTVHTSMSQKVNMPLDEQRKMYEAQRKYMKQALQDNKYVVDGAPIYESVSEVMRNFNIEGATEPLVAPTVAKPSATGLGARPSVVATKPSAASAAPEAPMPPQTPVQRALGDKASLLKEIDLVNKGNDKPEIKKQRIDILGSELNKVETIIKGAVPAPPAPPAAAQPSKPVQTPNQMHIAELNKDPSDLKKATFDAKFGAGSAALYLTKK